MKFDYYILFIRKKIKNAEVRKKKNDDNKKALALGAAVTLVAGAYAY